MTPSCAAHTPLADSVVIGHAWYCKKFPPIIWCKTLLSVCSLYPISFTVIVAMARADAGYCGQTLGSVLRQIMAGDVLWHRAEDDGHTLPPCQEVGRYLIGRNGPFQERYYILMSLNGGAEAYIYLNWFWMETWVWQRGRTKGATRERSLTLMSADFDRESENKR